jgi:alkylation response protein AidB-like acyl-CoA dehydrogenase
MASTELKLANTMLSSGTSMSNLVSKKLSKRIAKLGSEAQKDRYLMDIATGRKIACFALSEPDAGSDAAAIRTEYQENDDHFVINGKKKWITLSSIADIFLVFAQSNNTISAFLVDRDMGGITTTPISGLMASSSAHISEVEFAQVKVPKENLIGRLGMGFSFVANTALFYGRYSIAWAGCAISYAAIEEMVTYARKRKQFGSKIAQHQLIQGMIADSVTSLHMGRASCEKIGRLRIDNDDEAVTETNIAKLFTSRMAMEVTTTAIQVLGGNGICEHYPVERLFREAKVLEIIEGSTQIQQQMIAQYGLRKYFRKSSIKI